MLAITLLLEEAGQPGEPWEYQCPVCGRKQVDIWHDESWPRCEKSEKGKSHDPMSMYPVSPVKAN
jgi:hypothetical protein